MATNFNAKTVDAEYIGIDGAEADKLPELIDAEFSEPITPQKEYELTNNRNTRDYKYYEFIQPELQEWWEEFNTTLASNFCPQYKSAYQFAKAKAKNKREIELIYEMIGPKPERKTLRVPWLGDWKKRRQTGYTTPLMPSDVRELAKACKEEMETRKAVRSSAPYLVHELMMYSKMAEDVANSFNGQMFVPDIDPSDFKNLGRAKAYIVLQKSITRMKLELIDKWMHVHGVNPDKPETMIQINQLVQAQIASQGTSPESLSVKEVETLKLARMLKAHADSFAMPLPEERAIEVVTPEPSKPKNKVQ